MILVPARSDVTPVLDCIVHSLCSCGTVTESQLTICDFAAGIIFFHIIPRAERVLILDRRGLFTGEGNGPVRGVYTSQHDATWIPLRESSIQTIEEARDVHGTARAIRTGWYSHIEDQGHCAEFSGR